MPHPTNLKLTGDTHPHEADDLVMLEQDRAVRAGGPLDDSASTAGQSFRSQSDEPAADGRAGWIDRLPYAAQARGCALQARDKVGERPLAALGIAVALGFVVGKLLRR